VSGAVLLVLNMEVRDLTNSKLQQDFTNTYHTFQRFLTLRNERLVESCYLISELPVLKAQLSTKDPSTINAYVLKSDESPAKLLEVDVFTLTKRTRRGGYCSGSIILRNGAIPSRLSLLFRRRSMERIHPARISPSGSLTTNCTRRSRSRFTSRT